MNGSWSNSPTSFAYQWEDCNAAGAACVAIAGASAQTYTLTAADAGSTIRVVETASNATGAGTAATSAETAVVATVNGGSPPGGGTSGGGGTTTGGGGAAPGGGSAHTAQSAPNTKLVDAQINSSARRASFHFKATGAATGYECALVREPARKGAKPPAPSYAACGSSITFKHLKAGSYELFVRAVGPGGVDRSPATDRFRIA